MTDHTDLIARLRKDNLFWEAPITCRSETADALQAAQAEIEAQQHRIQALWIEHNAALARLAAIKKQEPVDYLYDWVHNNTTKRNNKTYTGFTKDKAHAEKHDNAITIYAAAGASPVQPSQDLQSIADALTIEQLNDKVERLMAVQPSQAGEVSKQDIYDIAHRKATRYVCTAAPSDVMYGFSEMHLLDFVAAINAKESGK